MRVLAINGSARADGNTALLIGAVSEELKKEGIETEAIQLAGRVIEPCKACRACGGKRNCAHRKDLFWEIYEAMVQADGILLGSPVYTANISANMQALLERASVVADMFVVGASCWSMSAGHFLRTVQYIPVCFFPCSCVYSRLISPSVSSWHKRDNTSICQSRGRIQRHTPYSI